MPQVRVLAGSIIVAAAAVLASVDSLEISSQLQPDPWSVESAVQRFAAVSAQLPTSDLASEGFVSPAHADLEQDPHPARWARNPRSQSQRVWKAQRVRRSPPNRSGTASGRAPFCACSLAGC